MILSRVQKISRVALFSALVYVLSWGTSFLPNISLMFFVIFLAGYLWGLVSGLLVGAIGMGLWTFFNPYGPAQISIMIAQIVGASLSGLVGYGFRLQNGIVLKRLNRALILILCAFLCTFLFFLPVNLIDAWLFQPFFERFIASSIWSIPSFISNMIIFPLLFVALEGFLKRELEG